MNESFALSFETEKRWTMRKKTSHANDDNELWMAPRYSLKGPQGERAWDTRSGGPPHSSRFLELADIALGLKKPTPKKKNKHFKHETIKKEPYSTEPK
jgi:hypothetical protein